jgi:cytochrome c oxidase subunit 3
MATLPTLKQPETSFGGGSNGPTDRFPGGGGGGGRGDQQPDYGERLRRYRLAMGIGLVAVFMLFLTFTITFTIRQVVGSWNPTTQTYVHDWIPVSLPMGLLLFNTLLMLASSVTLELSRREAFQRSVIAAANIPGVKLHEDTGVPWLGATLALGMGFLVGQLFAWREIMHRGFYLAGNPSSSFFYIITGMHGLHLIAGILALLYAAFFIRWRTHNLSRMRVALDVTAWYWHSMAFLWLYIFVLLKILD